MAKELELGALNRSIRQETRPAWLLDGKDGRGLSSTLSLERELKMIIRNKPYFLHCAGEAVQTIFEGLGDFEVGADQSKYTKTLKILDDYFIPKANIPYERHVFRNMKQESSETIDQFASRLRTQALNCDFGDAIDENIRDQIIDKCNSAQLRTKLLAKERI